MQATQTFIHLTWSDGESHSVCASIRTDEEADGLAVSPTELIGKYKGGTKERKIYRHLEIMFDFLHYRDLGLMCAVTVSAPHCCSAK